MIPLVFGFELSLFTLCLPLAFITSRIVLILLIPVVWSRCVSRLFQLKILEYQPDMSLIRLDRHAVATPLDGTTQDSSFSRSPSSPVTCVLISYFLDIILMRSPTADRSPPIVM